MEIRVFSSTRNHQHNLPQRSSICWSILIWPVGWAKRAGSVSKMNLVWRVWFRPTIVYTRISLTPESPHNLHFTDGLKLNVLFVSSANQHNEVKAIVFNQGLSLMQCGVQVDFFTIEGKGISGYLRNVPRLRRHLKKNCYDVIHGHYSDSALAATLSGAHPVVTSLMGSDLHGPLWIRGFVNLMGRLRWKATIVKSKRMLNFVRIPGALVIPNGVDFSHFRPQNKIIARQRVGFNSKRHIIFVADPTRMEKNFELAKEATALLEGDDIELNVVSKVDLKIMPDYMNAADVLLLTSLREGSPNVVKEAMACNLPVVSTDVGDVGYVIEGTYGCYITSFDPEDVAKKIQLALMRGGRTEGRRKIHHLDSQVIARKLIQVYESVI